MSMLVGALRATGARIVRKQANTATMYKAQVYVSRFVHTEATGIDAPESAKPMQQGTCVVCNETYEQF